ncbi:MAG TPA: pantetheine-phosphate adenylyltransferase [Sedimentisphaerales bacterium]|nr:pantetheine-phosphate adenylyltransferase [Sedimentisphaerales bacterium]
MQRSYVKALFPGSFDPITNGHLDVVDRALKLFDEVIIGVGNNPVKDQLFTHVERVEMIRQLVKDRPRVSVEGFNCLTVEFAITKKANVIIRGLRNLTDVQYEFQLAMTNRAIAGIETVFIMTCEQYGFTSSTLIREVANLGGDVSGLVPGPIYERLRARLSDRPSRSI